MILPTGTFGEVNVVNFKQGCFRRFIGGPELIFAGMCNPVTVQYTDLKNAANKKRTHHIKEKTHFPRRHGA